MLYYLKVLYRIFYKNQEKYYVFKPFLTFERKGMPFPTIFFENIKILSHQEVPDVRREEVQHGHHHLGQHVHVQANPRHTAVSYKKYLYLNQLTYQVYFYMPT